MVYKKESNAKKSSNHDFEIKLISRGSQHCEEKTTPHSRLLATSSWSQIAATSYPMPIQIVFIPNIHFDKKTHMFSKSRSHIGPQAQPRGGKQPQMDSLVMMNLSKRIVLNQFYNRSGFCVPFRKRIWCLDFRSQLLF